MTTYEPVILTNEETVVAKYERKTKRSDAYQSEAQLESAFIEMLQEQGYEYLAIKSQDELVANLRRQLERLNRIEFTDDEWETFYRREIANANEGIVEKTTKIQEDPIRPFTRADRTMINVKLFDKRAVHNNSLQVLNQYEAPDGARANRYDVTILVNGLPLVHVELKRRGVRLKEAFNQIERYQRESFWSGDGLFEFVQIFVISNGTYTKYYSNTTRASALKSRAGAKGRSDRSSASFEFTSYWADATNEPLFDLVDFTRTFFARHTILNVLAKYCVFTTDRTLLVMRPYQIAAAERIVSRIVTSSNLKEWTDARGGGYVWHTTGSGKTLTSFKTAQLATQLDGLDKVLFVVDRKDLDYQTMKEYDRFEKGAANGNRNTSVLTRQLSDPSCRIIITTIQKLQIFISKNPGHPIFTRHVAIIFDECHRSQFGEMHVDVAKAFKKRHLFGFTGTPIFAANASTSTKAKLHTTEEAFGDKLHAYTIVDAIRDGNVLPFRIDYVNTVRAKDEVDDELVEAIDRDKVMKSPERIRNVVKYILENFNTKTKRAESYSFRKLENIAEVATDKRNDGSVVERKESRRLLGFNSIFAASSIETAILYYEEFKRQLGDRFGKSMKIATIFSYAPNDESSNAATGLVDDENSDDATGLDPTSKGALDRAIADYNAMFSTNYDSSAERFGNYYKDLSLRMKNREVDLLIVVNMFLTGFDATTLNTLWVDKNLKMHGLLQAFSRTNRILNSVKTYGNVVCFRKLQRDVEDSIALFGDKEASGLVLLKTFDEYFHGYVDDSGKSVPGYETLLSDFTLDFPLDKFPLVGEAAEHEFIMKFGELLRLRNILTSFDEFRAVDPLAPIDLQDYTGHYNELHAKYRSKQEKEDVVDDLVFEMELVKQVEVNIDYILDLVAEYRDKHCKDKSILGAIEKAVKSSPDLRPKRELIDEFVATVTTETDDVRRDWKEFVEVRRQEDERRIVEEERLKPDEARKFIEKSFRVGAIETNGTEIDEFMPPAPRFRKAADGESRAQKKERIVDKLVAFFDKYFGLI